MADRDYDDRILRWVLRKAYGIRKAKPDQIRRYQFWHRLSRTVGLDAAGPWECWPAKPIPPDAIESEQPFTPGSAEPEKVRESVAEPSVANGQGSSIASQAPPLLACDAPEQQMVEGEEKSVPLSAQISETNGNGESHNVAAREANKAGNGRPRAKERAEAVVRERLANGAVSGESIKAAAAAAKVSERTLIAAAERLNVRCWKGMWFLPG
jgi:hypothetical protein